MATIDKKLNLTTPMARAVFNGTLVPATGEQMLDAA